MEFHATFVKRDIEQSIASIDDKLEINRTIDNITRLKNDSEEGQRFYSPMLEMDLAMPEWEALITILALGLVIIITIVGKNDVVLSGPEQINIPHMMYLMLFYTVFIL